MPGVPDGAVDGNVPENPVADKPLNSIHINLEAAAKWRDGFYQIADALEQAGAGWPGALEDWGKVQAALSAVAAAFEKGVSASQNIGSAAGTFLSTLSSSVDVESAKAQLTGAMEDAGSMSRSLEQVFKIFSDVTRQLSKDGPVEFASINEEARTASENLYASLGNLSKEMQSLNSTMQNNGDVLTEDIRAISHQFNVVFNVLLDSVASLQDGDGKKAEDYIQDTSDEDIAATRLGKVTDCRSTGTVEGDRNVGGILGAMAIEYDLDPEDDIERFSIANTYEIKVVLENCVNNGKVTGKKDCVGGLVGRMDLGTAVGGQNYGAVESTAGNYVGGAVGWSDGFIRRCYAKSTLSGGNYVGGIAGWADKLTDSSAIVTVLDGTECVGAVAGDADLTEACDSQ